VYRNARVRCELFAACCFGVGGRNPVISSDVDSLSMEVVYINLNERTDRKKRLEGMLARLRIQARRFSAIRVDEESLINDFPILDGRDYSSHIRSESESGRWNIGALGCYLSHREILAEVIPNHPGCTLILEDDVWISSPEFFRYAIIAAQRLSDPWDILLFDCGGSWNRDDRVKWNIFFPRSTFPTYWGTHAVLVRNERAPHVVKVLDSSVVHAIDAIYLTNRTQIRSYVIRTGMCGQIGLDSDILPSS